MASLLKRYRSKAKEYGRKALAVGAKVSKVARPIVSAGAGYFLGPVGVAGVNAISHYGQQYQVASAARSEGIRGREARQLGRTAAQRTTQHSLIAGSAGVVGAAVMGGLGAGLFGTLGQQQLGVGSGSGLFGLSNPLMGEAAPVLGSAVDLSTIGSQTALQGVKFGWDSLGKTTPPTTPGPEGSGGSAWNEMLMAGATALGGGSDTPGGQPGGNAGGGLGGFGLNAGVPGQPGESSGLGLLIAGALLLFALGG